MSTTRRFEGPELGALLEQVHTALGPDARVVAANRCRSGGVGGFFARESFEVFVELLDEHDDAELAPLRPLARPSAATRARRPGATGPAGGANAALEQMIAAAELADGLGAPASAERHAAHPERALRFDDALDRAVERQQGAPARLRGAGRSADEVAKPSRAERRRQRKAAKRGHPAPAPGGYLIDLPMLEGGSGPVGERHAGASARPGTTAGAPFSTHLPMSSASGRSTAHASTVHGSTVHGSTGNARSIAAPGPLSGPSAGSLSGPLSMRAGAPSTLWPTDHLVSADALVRLGVPASWFLRMDDLVAVSEVLSRVTDPPPLQLLPGSTVAFVGRAEQVLATARAVATSLHQDPDECVLLSPTDDATALPCERLRSLDDLAQVRPQWAQLDRVTVVAIDVDFGRPHVAWGRQALATLRPRQTWGVVDATRKAEDVREWAHGVGGIDALAVHGIADTASPAAVLGVGIPVARVDGRVANADLWTKVLEERLDVHTRRQFAGAVGS